MITKELYFNGEYVDLLPNTVIALTFQAGDIGDLRTRSADYSATINIPKTNKNRRTFGNIDLINSRSKIPYRKGRVDYNQAGLNIIVGGTGVVTESAEFYKLSIYNGIVDFFGAIDGKNVDDLDFEVYETIDDTYIESIRLSTDLFSAPVIDFGTLFPHPQELKNTNFLLDGDWTNVGSSNEWDHYFTPFDLRMAVFFADTNAPQSDHLTQDYKFFNGFKYRLTLSFEVQAPYVSAVINEVDLYIGTGSSRQLIAQVANPTTGTYIIDETFLAGADYNEIQIYSEGIGTAPGEDARVFLNSIKVTDIAGIIDIKTPYYIPLISYSRVIDKIITSAGYTSNLLMTNQAYYEKLYITFSKSKYEYPDRLINKMKFRAIGSGSQVILVNDSGAHAIQFSTIIESGAYGWYNGVDTFQVPAWPYSIEYVVRARIIINVSFSGGSTDAQFYFTLDGITDSLQETVLNAAPGVYVFTFDSNVIVTDGTPKNFKITVKRSGSANVTVSVIESEFWVDINAKAFGVVNLSALILPTKPQKDFIKDFMMRFGILANEKNGILTLSEMQNTIGTSYEYVDWTSKRDKSVQESLKFDPKNYAQENIFTDIISEDAIFLGASDTIDIDDETLPASKTFYTSIMAAVEQNNNNGMRLCRIELFDRVDNSPTYIASPALLYVRENKSGDSEVMYSGDVKSSFLVCVYNDPLFEFNTTWEYFLKKYYPLISAALQMAKVPERLYNLSPLDIAKLNIFKLVYDDGQLFLINNASKYVPGKSTRVQLFKVL